MLTLPLRPWTERMDHVRRSSELDDDIVTTKLLKRFHDLSSVMGADDAHG